MKNKLAESNVALPWQNTNMEIVIPKGISKSKLKKVLEQKIKTLQTSIEVEGTSDEEILEMNGMITAFCEVLEELDKIN